MVRENSAELLPKAAADVLKLSRSGVGDTVILAYVGAAQPLYNLSATDVLHLVEAGLPAPILAAMLKHDQALRSSEASNRPPDNRTSADLAASAPELLADAPVRVYAEPSLTPQVVDVVSGSPGPEYYRGSAYGGVVWIAPGWRFRAGYDPGRPHGVETSSHGARARHAARALTAVNHAYKGGTAR